MFSSFKKITCSQPLFLSDSECSGGVHYNIVTVQYDPSATDCSGAQEKGTAKYKVAGDGITITYVLDGKETVPTVASCPHELDGFCSCSALEKFSAAKHSYGRIHFDTFSNMIHKSLTQSILFSFCRLEVWQMQLF